MAAPSTTPLRVRLLIDRQVQGALLCRAGIYAAAGLLYMCCVLYFSQALADPSLSWGQHFTNFAFDAFCWAPGVLVLMPIVAHDVLRMSNRFAGPVFRLRSEMQVLAAGEDGREIKFRDEDQWTELAPLYNQLRAELLELRNQVAAPPLDRPAAVNASPRMTEEPATVSV
ncbi:hypothetical protein [Roseimaritima ulvae]|uniref:HAMP domain-containing protein n=1 Tax=Roseimaritima ulvae TaxID=980254 RepID=A0A5B9QUZ1_9BACT|nr:hypothetical protein [Roseimaritima ulvae]QEG42858.1 hypothetical protein UC8_49000 [Roseimaritima ulvae]